VARFEAGGTPWIRSRLRKDSPYVCPFCGAATLILSYGDVPDDDLRVEAYCDYIDCEVREMTILAMRIGGPAGRADIDALKRIDVGDARTSTRDLTGFSILERDAAVLARRRTPRT
jgi:hypothetical protein